MGIRAKLILILMLAALVPLLLGIVSLEILGRRYYQAQRGRLLAIRAEDLAATLGRGLSEQIRDLRNWVELSDINVLLAEENRRRGAQTEADRTAEIQHIERTWPELGEASPIVSEILGNAVADRVRAFKQLNPLFVELLVTDRWGRIVGASNKSSDYWQADEVWWQEARAAAGGRAWTEGIHYDDSAGVYSLDVGVPLSPPEGTTNRVAGVLKAVLDVSPLLRSLASSRAGTETIQQVVLDSGLILVRLTGPPVPALAQRVHPPTLTALRESAARWTVWQAGKEETLVGHAALTIGRERDTPLLTSDLTPMHVLVGQPLSVVMAPVRRHIHGVALCGGAVVLFFAIAAYYLASHQLLAPMRALRAAAQSISAAAHLDPAEDAAPAVAPRKTAAALVDKVSGMKTRGEIRDLVHDFALMATRVLNYHEHLQGEIKRNTEDMREDLVMAREFQESLLPDACPLVPAPGADDRLRLQFSHVYRPALSVGGDFFHILQVSEHGAGVFIADVMGHGARAALVTATLHTLLQDIGERAPQPGDALAWLNSRFTAISERLEGTLFVTACYVVLDTAKAEIQYAAAGHPAPLVTRRGDNQVSRLLTPEETGPALGLYDDSTYATRTRGLSPGDILLLYTDGILEALNPRSEEFGQERLAGALAAAVSRGEDALPQVLLASLGEFMGTALARDDICMLAVEAVDA